MLYKPSLNLRWFRFCSWRKLWFLSFILLLLLALGLKSASAQTATPVVVTGVPGATPTGGAAAVQSRTVTFNFTRGEAGFNSLFGFWAIGLGYQSTGGFLDLLGGYYMEDISSVVVNYGSTVPFEYSFQVCATDCFDDEVNYEILNQPGDVCEGAECLLTFSPGSVNGGTLKFAFLSDTAPDGLIVVHSVVVTFSAASPEYDVDENGCPVLSSEQIRELDPVYYASCARCFNVPTPVRANAIPTKVVTVAPTLSGTAAANASATFAIPIIVSGTAVTVTPGGGVGVPGGGSTFTPTPTSTSGATSTPLPFIEWDFTTSMEGWTIHPDDDHVAFGYVNSNGYWEDGTGFWADWDTYTFRKTLWIESPHANYINATDIVVYQSTVNLFNTTLDYYDDTDTPICSSNGAIGYQCSDPPAEFNYLVLYRDTGVWTSGGEPGWYINVMGIDLYASTDEPVSTSTPSPTATAAPTGAAWVDAPIFDEPSCEVASWRDSDPVASFEEGFEIVDYHCYLVVPEVEILIFEPDVEITGVNLCITWFQLPVVTVLGITVTMDWLLIGIVAFMLNVLLRF